MRKWGKYLLAAIVVLFVGSNLFLLFKEDSKVARTVNVSDWTSIDKSNVKKILHTTGETEPEIETHVYFDNQKGTLDTILVKEGDVVTSGTPLFSYNSQKLEEKKSNLEDEAERLQGEMNSIDQEISQLQLIYPDESSNTTSAESNDKKVKIDVDVNTSSIVEGNIQQRIAEAEAEKGKLEAALTANDAKLSRVEDQLTDLNVTSTVDGQIVNINADLKDPMITIASNDSVVKAIVPAKQVEEVAEGQQVKLYSTLLKKTYNGTVSQVITYPNQKEKGQKEPTYSFIVQLNGEVVKEAKLAKQAKTDNNDNASEADLNAEEMAENPINNETGEQATDEGIEEDPSQAGQNADATLPDMEEEKPLLVGTHMNLQVVVAEATNVPVISSTSMWKADKKHYAYQLTSKGMIQKQEITLGVSYKGKNQVVKGLQENDTIIRDKNAISIASPSNFITPIKTVKIQKNEFKKMTKKQQTKYILIGLFE